MLMFEVFSASAEIWLVVVLVLLLLCPVAFYLRGPWAYRRQEILNGLSARSVELYFNNFYPGLQNPDFRKFYHQRFSRRPYIIPWVVLVTSGLLVSFWTMRL